MKGKIQDMTFSLSVKPKSTWDSLRKLPSSFHSVIQSKGPCHVQLRGILAKDQLKETSNKCWSVDEIPKAFCLLLNDSIKKNHSIANLTHWASPKYPALSAHSVRSKKDDKQRIGVIQCSKMFNRNLNSKRRMHNSVEFLIFFALLWQ